MFFLSLYWYWWWNKVHVLSEFTTDFIDEIKEETEYEIIATGISSSEILELLSIVCQIAHAMFLLPVWFQSLLMRFVRFSQV